jgi:hypothetical protein
MPTMDLMQFGVLLTLSVHWGLILHYTWENENHITWNGKTVSFVAAHGLVLRTNGVVFQEMPFPRISQ